MTNQWLCRPLLMALGVVGALAASPAAAQAVYRWTDAEGVTHFSAQPPADQKAEQIKVQAPPPATPPETGGASESTADEDRPKDPTEGLAGPTPEELAEIERQRAQNCQTAKQNLETLKTRAHVRVRDEATGEDRYLSAEEHQQWQKDSALRIDEYCAPADGG